MIQSFANADTQQLFRDDQGPSDVAITAYH
jgi:hypothetical protein